MMQLLDSLRGLRNGLDIEAFARRWPRHMDEPRLAQEVESLLSRMSVQEKVAQMSGDGGHLVLLKLGIFVLGLKRFPNIYAGCNTRLGIPPISFTDGPRGIVIGNATCFPAAMTRGASFDPALEQRVGEAIGLEARASGANYYAGLCVNLLRHPAWGRAQETYGEDSHHLAQMGVALMRGVQSQHVMVCAKHFAVNSIENSRFYLDVQIDAQTLHEIYLPHFRALVDAGVDSLMSAYNQVNGEYCGHSSELLQDILRGQWGFTGFVTSDWLWGIYQTVKPALAGMDIEMPRGHFYGRRLLNAVRRNAVPLDSVNDCVRRILTAKLRWLSHVPDTRPDPAVLACDAHRTLAQDAAEASMVLLKNSGALPWDERVLQGKTLAVIGDLAALPCLGDHGSSRVSPPSVVTFLDGLQQRAGGFATVRHCDGQDTAAAVQLAASAAAVLVVAGYHAEDEGENLTSNRKPVANPRVPRGGDRASLALSPTQQALIRAVCEANPSTVVAVVAGSAVMMNHWQDRANAILFAGYPGMQGGHALARLLFGDVSPSGKLPFTVPATEAQLPPFDRWAASAEYGYFHGYTLLDRLGQQPAFPFGFGLSYTTFALHAAQADRSHYSTGDTVTITTTLQNTGQRHGAEVVQCYVGHRQPSLQPAALKRLEAFSKHWLAPGESCEVTLQVPVQSLARYEVANQGWRVEPGEYTLWVGTSSAAEDLTALTVRIGD